MQRFSLRAEHPQPPDDLDFAFLHRGLQDLVVQPGKPLALLHVPHRPDDGNMGVLFHPGINRLREQVGNTSP